MREFKKLSWNKRDIEKAFFKEVKKKLIKIEWIKIAVAKFY